MRVAYITMNFPAPSETFAGTDILTLRRSGIDVSVHTLRPPPSNATTMLEERRLADLRLNQGTLVAHVKGLPACFRRPLLLVRLLMWLLQTSWKRPMQLVASIAVVPRSFGILAGLEREQPDVVHLFWGHYPCVVGYLALTGLPSTVLSMFLGAYDLTRRYGGTAWIARRADLVFTHAACNVPSLEELGVPPNRIRRVYRGIDLTAFDGVHAQKTKQRIVSIGRLDKGKGMDDVLRVFRDVHARWPNATLRVLGQGPLRAELEQLSRTLRVSGSASFLGHLTHKEVAAELSVAEVFLLMSWDETERLPNVVKEAIASRCLCVVTETSGMNELVKDSSSGFLVTKGNVADAAARVDDVFSGRVDVEPLLAMAMSHVARHFDVCQSMQSYQQSWHHAVAGRSMVRRKTTNATDCLTADVTTQRSLSD